MMSVDRQLLVRAVEEALDGRRLVWAGIRGDDVEPLVDLPQLAASFSIFSRYKRRSSVESLAYEDVTSRRVDPEVWDIDEHLDEPATTHFRHGLLRSLAGASALIPYRPSQFLSAIWFARRDVCTYLGLFGAHQSAFEHKPWVENAVARELGLPHIPWTYIADEEQLLTRDKFESGPVMLRRSRTSGGEGMVKVDDARQVLEHWPAAAEAFVSVAPYLDGGLPVNVGATVWRDGVTVHHPSVQLIGIPGLVGRPFGYAGNDFGAMRDVDTAIIDEIESSTIAIGNWLRAHGYRGTFGVDYLVHEGRALFTEVNPRFQGSTHASSRLSIEAGEGCLMLEHIAAWIGMPRPSSRPLRELVRETSDLAHVIFHWGGSSAQQVDAQALQTRLRNESGGTDLELLPATTTVCDPGAAVARWTTRQRVTEDGYRLLPRLRDLEQTELLRVHDRERLTS